jgi:hypothetical protein
VQPKRGVTNCVTPVDQTLLRPVIKARQTRRQRGKFLGGSERTGQRVRSGKLGHVAAGRPVRTLPRLLNVRINQCSLAEITHVIVNEIIDSERMTRPIHMRFTLGYDMTAAVADSRIVS